MIRTLNPRTPPIVTRFVEVPEPDDLVGLGAPRSRRPPAPVPDVPGQQAIPDYHGLGLGQQKLMKARES